MSSSNSELDLESINIHELLTHSSRDDYDIDIYGFSPSESETGDTNSLLSNFSQRDILTEKKLFEDEENLINFQNIPIIHEEYSIEKLINEKSDENIPSLLQEYNLISLKRTLIQIKNKLNYGYLACMTACESIIAVGTSRGLVLIFSKTYAFNLDINTQSAYILSESTIENFSSVNCVAVSPKCNHIAAAIKNFILIWKISKIESKPQIIQFDQNVIFNQIHVKSISSFCSLVTIRKSGLLSPILMRDMPSHRGIFVLLLKTRNNLTKKLFKSKFHKNLDCRCTKPTSIHPLIFPRSWDAIIHRDYTLFCISFGSKIIIMSYKPIIRKISFFNMTTGATLDTLSFSRLAAFKTDSFVYFTWMSDRILINLTSSKILGLIDTNDGSLIEVNTIFTNQTIDIDNVDIAVSPSPTDLRDLMSAYRNSITYSKGLLFIISKNVLFLVFKKNIQAYTIRSFVNRISLLVSNNQYMRALSLLANVLSDNRAMVFDSPNIDGELILKFTQYILLYFEGKFERDLPVNAENSFLFHYSKVFHKFKFLDGSRAAFKYLDFIFDVCLPYVQNKIYSYNAFLECLAPLIINNKLTKIPYVSLRAFKDRLFLSNQHKLFESCLLKIDVKGMDHSDLLDSCWKYKLYDSIFYMFSLGLNDCITPLKILLLEIENSEKHAHEKGNKIVKNIGILLTDPQNPQYFKQIMKFLCEKYDSDDNKISWRYLKILIKFDFKVFVDILTLAFNRITQITNPVFLDNLKNTRNKLIHIVLQIIFGDRNFSAKDVSIFFIFLSRQVSMDSEGIKLNKIMLYQILECLTSDVQTNAFEKQQALLGLLSSGAFDQLNFDSISELCFKLKYNLICEFIYEKQCKYDILIKYMALNDDRKCRVFDTISYLLENKLDSENIFNSLQDTTVEIIENLIQIDPCRTVYLIKQHFYTIIDRAFKNLKEIKSFIEDNINCENYIKLMCQYEPSKVDNFVKIPGLYRDTIIITALSQHKLLLPLSIIYERIEMYIDAAHSLLEVGSFVKTILNFRNQIKLLVDSNEFLNDNKFLFDDFSRFLAFMSRIFRKISRDELKKLWFSLIDEVSKALELCQGDLNRVPMCDYLTRLGNWVFTEMSKQIPIEDILNRFIDGNTYKSLPFGDLKTMLTLLSDNNNFEETFSLSLRKILAEECNSYILGREKTIFQGASLINTICLICGTPLHTSNDKKTSENHVL
ncbi:hypothetical protein HZS_1638, partial [Henneguya salminicola]